MFYAWDKINKIVAVAKTELWYMGIVALAAYKSGTVFIDRKKPKDAYKSLRKIKEVLKTDGAKVWIYPEGTRNTGNTVKLLPFKKGAFTLAVDAQVPIIPIVFSPHYFINDKKHIFYNDGKAIIRCLEPVPTEGLTSEDIPELQERLHQIMWDAFVPFEDQQNRERGLSWVRSSHPGVPDKLETALTVVVCLETEWL
ncbi:Acyltransferase AGPAT4 [Operophtera brumata]|uniref:1-acylglycerol-3-phosphate O-acyltransferase n=1 Tax=Operophtera brumata TaxID=104452 RepID=A0A0L7L4X5_OPEBR|nr:Acyltransferase AGPAT4 [Operophtera brumata]